MSAETMEWLNTFTLIGQTDRRGKAWHYREEDQGGEPNHYTGFIPVPDVIRRLFGWSVITGDVKSTGSIITPDGVESFTITDDARKTMLRPPRALGPEDPGGIMGIFKSGYEGHNYEEWLIRQVATLLDDDLGITSAGLLAKGAQAWVEVSVPDTITTPEGVTFRPNLLCTTSFDGSLATTYKRSVNDTVCDNTRAMVLGGEGEVFRVKHTKNSSLKLLAARDALALVHTIGDDFAAEVAALCETTVTDAQFAKFLDELVPVKDENGDPKIGRALTNADKKREELKQLWNHDERCAPWKGTAHGVVQTVNTWAHHVQSFKGRDRAGRNMAMTVNGDVDKLDMTTLMTLGKVLQPA
jgi:phage/plasmid-like protein (TIGR03299 family)